MKICLLTSELSPFAKTGGLGDAVTGLARFLSNQGVDVRLFMPFYSSSSIEPAAVTPVEFLQGLHTELAGRSVRYKVHTTPLPGSSLPIYLVDCPALYDRSGIYDERGDEHLRFGLLARATIESCQHMGFGPDVFHLNDWHTALVPIYLRTLYGWDGLFSNSRTLLTIHNLAFQGIFPAAEVEALGLAPARSLLHQQELARGRLNFMTTGILHADHLSTVSRTYAHEIQTPAHGFGLDPLLRRRSDHLAGLVNGVDYGEWDPSADTHIPYPYSAASIEDKERNKKALLEEVGLPYEQGVAALGVVSRLTAQKGFDLCFESLPELLGRRDFRLVVLGSGEAHYERFFHQLRDAFPEKVHFHAGFSNPLAHRIQAGCDMLLVPSLYEPCGLTQLYSLRYGTVPVVRRTGGLADTVELYDSAAGTGTGFVFDDFDPRALRWALDYALDSYADPERWRRLMANGMSQDFSWERQGEPYLDLYQRL
jgi:starch synthase